MRNALAAGIYENLSNHEYHSDSAVGSSTLKTLATKTPLHVKSKVYKESPAFDLGSAVHLAILEPHYSDKIIRGADTRRGNSWKDAKLEADASGHILLTSEDYDDVFRMRDSVHRHKYASSLLTGNVKAELSLFHEIEGTRVKIRPDNFNYDGNVMLDLNTAVSASPDLFAKSVAMYGYHIQQSFYQRVWEDYHGSKIDDFLFLVVEKEAPFAVAIYRLDEWTMAEGYHIVERTLKQYRECLDGDTWEGYPETIQTLRLPQWAFQCVDIPA